MKKILWEGAVKAIQALDTLPRLPKSLPHHERYYRLDTPLGKIKFAWHFSPGNTKTTAWFFHGFGSSETNWVNPNFLSTKKWLEVQHLMPQSMNVISVSFGSSWMLSPFIERSRGKRDAIVNNFLEIVPHLEQKLGLDTQKRVILGSSMGGFNAYTLWSRIPWMWEGALFHVPLVCLCDPFNWFDMSCLAGPLVRGSFSKTEWYEVDVFQGAKRLLTKDLAPCQIQVSKNDGFKFYEPGVAFARTAHQADVSVELVENPGGHKDMDAFRAAQFLSQFIVV